MTGETVLSAEDSGNTGNLWAVRAPRRTLLGSSQRYPDPVAGGEGVVAPSPLPGTPPQLSAFHPSVSPSAMKSPGHALAQRSIGGSMEDITATAIKRSDAVVF